MSKQLAIQFAKRTAIATATLALLYTGLAAAWRHFDKKSQAPAQTSLHTTLHENLLILEEIKDIDSSNITVGLDLDTLMSSLNTNLENYNKLSADKDKLKEKNADLLKKTDAVIQKEKAVIYNLTNTYEFFKKPLLYRPIQDLGSLAPTTNSQDISSRIDEATKSLDAVSKGISRKKSSDNIVAEYKAYVSTDTQAAIYTANLCLNNIKTQLGTSSPEAFQKSVKNCDEQYASVRQNAAKDVARSLQTNEANELFELLSRVVTDLNSQFEIENTQRK